MYSLAMRKSHPPASQPPTPRPQTTAGSSQSEVARTVSANSVLARRYLKFDGMRPLAFF
jgi:hypothetical protein